MSYWDCPEVLAAFALKDYISETRDNNFLLDALASINNQKGIYNKEWYADHPSFGVIVTQIHGFRD